MLKTLKILTAVAGTVLLFDTTAKSDLNLIPFTNILTLSVISLVLIGLSLAFGKLEANLKKTRRIRIYKH